MFLNLLPMVSSQMIGERERLFEMFKIGNQASQLNYSQLASFSIASLPKYSNMPLILTWIISLKQITSSTLANTALARGFRMNRSWLHSFMTFALPSTPAPKQTLSFCNSLKSMIKYPRTPNAQAFKITFRPLCI